MSINALDAQGTVRATDWDHMWLFRSSNWISTVALCVVYDINYSEAFYCNG